MIQDRGFMCMKCGQEWLEECIKADDCVDIICPDCGSAEINRTNFGSDLPADKNRGLERRRNVA
jgi:predicted RNA-binding Zn-ribbon protein involved in translation (DUF1610 family)